MGKIKNWSKTAGKDDYHGRHLRTWTHDLLPLKVEVVTNNRFRGFKREVRLKKITGKRGSRKIKSLKKGFASNEQAVSWAVEWLRNHPRGPHDFEISFE